MPAPRSAPEAERVRHLIRLDAARLIERFDSRRTDMVGLFSRLRDRSALTLPVESLLPTLRFGDLVVLEPDEQSAVLKFSDLVEEVRWYLRYTEHMPGALGDAIDDYRRALLIAHAELLQALAPSPLARPPDHAALAPAPKPRSDKHAEQSSSAEIESSRAVLLVATPQTKKKIAPPKAAATKSAAAKTTKTKTATAKAAMTKTAPAKAAMTKTALAKAATTKRGGRATASKSTSVQALTEASEATSITASPTKRTGPKKGV